jgi:hypothetical protein
MAIDYLGFGDVLAIHAKAMERLGEEPADLRPPWVVWASRLDSLLLGPSAAAYVEGADLIRQAAILAIDIAQVGPFRAFNYLTAYYVMKTFLRYNLHGLFDLNFEVLDALGRIVGQHDRLTAIDQFEAVLRPHAREL